VNEAPAGFISQANYLFKGSAMLLQDILRQKGSAVHTIRPEATLDDVVQTLVRHNCGSLVVTAADSSSSMLGIITERDILKACAAKRAPLDQVRVSEAMTTKDVAMGTPADSVEETMGTMTNRRIRHLPVVADGRLIGIVSIGDIVKAQHDHLTMENHYLKTYIHGEVDTPLTDSAVFAKPR
jgi:CBS domain-containing protein